MKKTITSQFLALLTLLVIFFVGAPSAYAQTALTMPLLQMDGLTFDTPLSVSTDSSGSLSLMSSLQFGINKPMVISEAKHSTDLTELLVAPVAHESTASALVLGAESTASATSAPSPGAELSMISSAEAAEPSITPKPTAIATKKAVASPVPSVTPTTAPTATPKATSTPEATNKPTPTNEGGLSADRIFELVNNYRSTKGLVAVQKDDRACEVARSRAPEVGAEIAGGYMHKGIRERNLPYFNSEIIISMRNEESAVNWWIGDTIHREQMEGDYKYSCAACSGQSCVQEFTNFVSKG